MALDDLYQTTHKFAAFGVTMHNVYHSERVNPGETAQDINDAFAFSIRPHIRALQPTFFTNIELVTFSLGDSQDFHTQAIADAGLRVVIDASPSFVAAGVRFPTRDRDVHAGQKRFAGLVEADIQTGVIIAATLVLVQDIADALLLPWLASSDSHQVANYVIIKRVCDEVDPVSGDCLQYRLPKDAETPVYYQPNSSVLNSDATSQVSRKTF